MKEAPVVIIGAGPSGLVLGLSLAQYEIYSTILERDLDIGEDPRGVYLAGDAVRVLYQLGIGGQMSFIGEESQQVNFHQSDFRNPAFFQIPTGVDWPEQVVPAGIFQIQPRLEAVLRDAVSKSTYCNLQTGCNVISREELPDEITVHYEQKQTKKRIKASWLIGADGKTGVVRKRFLEPTAGVHQVVGLHEYTATWVAANLKITLPTPETHPNFTAWKMNMSSEEVYDLFWPENWHFCAPPGKATACGRFGPKETRLWRHEFAEPDWDDSKDAVELMWEHLTPMITRRADRAGNPFEGGEITFPRDCVKVLRCRPFTFTQKVVNKWFHDRTILIGDAAHVFPPFGGQGIASGIRDADGLAWRLALLLRRSNSTKELRDVVLQVWSDERRQGVDDSTRLTMMNGELCNKPETWGFFIFRHLTNLISYIPGAPSLNSLTQAAERAGYKATKNGFFLSEFGGGGKVAQIYVKSSYGRLMLSDELLRRGKGVMTVLILNSNFGDADTIKERLRRINMPESVLSEESVLCVSSRHFDDRIKGEMYRLCPRDELEGVEPGDIYNDQRYLRRFPRGTEYAIVRPDLIIFAACRSIPELEICLITLKDKLRL